MKIVVDNLAVAAYEHVTAYVDFLHRIDGASADATMLADGNPAAMTGYDYRPLIKPNKIAKLLTINYPSPPKKLIEEPGNA